MARRHAPGLPVLRQGTSLHFFASGILALGPKLGPILWQFPPNLEYDRGLVESFLELLPHSTSDAVTVATRRDERMAGKDYLVTDALRPVRHAIEPRSHSFDTPDFAEQLERHSVAAVLGDSAGRWPVLDWVTTDFAYARLHGDTELYVSGYDEAGLDKSEAWTRRHLEQGRDVHAYFDNDVKVRSPLDAMALLERLRR